MGHKVVVLLPVRFFLRVMAMKKYVTLLRAHELVPHYQIPSKHTLRYYPSAGDSFKIF